MKLSYRITLRISAALLLLFAAWGTLFYIIIIDEINDETDDTLEDYSEYIITKALSGEELPQADNGTNNSYYITQVNEYYARTNPTVQYLDDEVYIYTKQETEPARIHKTIFKDQENRYFELTVMIPTIEKHDLRMTILYWMVILYLLLLGAVVIVNAVVIRNTMRPLYTMLDWLNNLRPGDIIPPLTVETSVKEFNILSDALVRSAQRNADAYEQQSLFIGHASHELQTPLAVATNRLELLADDPSLGESQLEQIVKTRRSLENIAKLNKTLLLLTRIENRQFPESVDNDLGAMVESLCMDFNEAYAHRGITCSVEAKTKLTVQMNKTLASVLLGNLIKNAYTHSPNQGRVHITVDDNRVTISNTAASGALNPEYIFRRFYHNASHKGSAGLGLSLAESISKLYGIQIKYEFLEGDQEYGQSDQHLFSVIFPSKIKK